MSFELWPEQRPAYDFAIAHDKVALFCEQRTGKTFLTLAILRKLAGNAINLHTGKGNDFAGVLLCLLNNRDTTWLDNLGQHMPWLSVYTNWDEYKAAPTPKLFLVHFEAFPKIIGKMVKYKKINWMGIDEAHRIAKRGTKQSRAAARMSWVRRKLILTGTPIEKKPTDLWAQFRFLDPEVFGKSWDKFETEYMDFPKLKMDKIPRGSKAWQVKILQQRIMRSKATFKRSKLRQFNNLIKPYSFRLTKKDVGIKEPTVEQVIVPVLGEQRRLYRKMKKTGVIRLSTGERVMAELEVTNIVKRRQIASGFVYDDDGEVHMLTDPKLRKLIHLFEKAPKPVVIFCVFRPALERIVTALRERGYDIDELHGGVKKKDRPAILRRFQKAQVDGIVCQNRTGGVGVDLWKASLAIVHSMSHSYIDYDQLKSRLDNRVKKKGARVLVLCGDETIDMDLYDLVIVKRLNAEEVLSQLKRR